MGRGDLQARGRVLIAGVVLAGLLAGCAGTRVVKPPQRAGAPHVGAASAPSGPPSPTPGPQGPSIPIGQLHAVTFVRPSSGWALGTATSGTVVARSVDGGRSWHAWGAPLPGVSDGFEASLVVMLAGNGVGSNVADAVVSVVGSSTLFVSTDRMGSWSQVHFPAPVLAVAADPGPSWPGGTSALAPGVDSQPLWVLIGPLPTTESPAQARGLAPPGSLLEVLLYPASSAWKAYGTLRGPRWTGHSAVGTAGFVRTGTSSGFAVVDGTAADASAPAGYEQVALVEETTDYGASWRPLAIPCTSETNFSIMLSAVSLDELWLGCGGEPGAGNEVKTVYRSSDAGVRWHEVWNGRLGTTPPSARGEMTPGYLNEVVALSAQDAYIGLGRGALLQTTDAGWSWETAIPHIGGSGGVEELDMLDASQGWALIGGRLWATTNGEHWQQIAQS